MARNEPVTRFLLNLNVDGKVQKFPVSREIHPETGSAKTRYTAQAGFEPVENFSLDNFSTESSNASLPAGPILFEPTIELSLSLWKFSTYAVRNRRLFKRPSTVRALPGMPRWHRAEKRAARPWTDSSLQTLEERSFKSDVAGTLQRSRRMVGNQRQVGDFERRVRCRWPPEGSAQPSLAASILHLAPIGCSPLARIRGSLVALEREDQWRLERPAPGYVHSVLPACRVRLSAREYRPA